MNDTFWVAFSQTELSYILSITKSFYTIANIQVNLSKSILVTNNPSPHYTPISYNNHLLSLHSPKQPFKFLGCWFTLDNRQFKQTKLIIAESSQLIQIAKFKHITDSHARYIINTVIISTIKYYLHNIVIN